MEPCVYLRKGYHRNYQREYGWLRVCLLSENCIFCNFNVTLAFIGLCLSSHMATHMKKN